MENFEFSRLKDCLLWSLSRIVEIGSGFGVIVINGIESSFQMTSKDERICLTLLSLCKKWKCRQNMNLGSIRRQSSASGVSPTT